LDNLRTSFKNVELIKRLDVWLSELRFNLVGFLKAVLCKKEEAELFWFVKKG